LLLAHSFNHLVSAGKQRWGNVDPKRLGRFQIDEQLDLSGLLYWQMEGKALPADSGPSRYLMLWAQLLVGPCGINNLAPNQREQ
jgi:hypothetical protein